MTVLNVIQCHYFCQAEKEIPGLTQQIVGEILKSGSKCVSICCGSNCSLVWKFYGCLNFIFFLQINYHNME